MAGNGDEGFSDEDSPALGGRHGGPSSYMGDFRSYASPSSVGGDINGAPDVVMDDLEYNMELFGQRNEALGILQHGMEEELAFIGHRELQMDIIPNLRDNEAEPPSAQPDDMRFVVENVAIDLDTYVGAHSGIIKTQRLQHVAKHCPQLRVDALKMILKHLMENSLDFGLYSKTYEELKSAIGSGLTGEDGDAILPKHDDSWVRESKRNFDARLDKLDHDLKNYKTNSIKESIRRGHDEIGNHYLIAGDAHNAFKAFNKARDYGEGLKEMAQILANRLKACVYLRSFPNANVLIEQMKDIGSSIERNAAAASKEPKSKDANGVGGSSSNHVIADKQLETAWNLIRACMALYYMSVGKFKEAADLFVTLNPEHCDFPTVLVGRDIAVYGAICAVATYDRQNLQEKIISNKSFKSFLETAPEVRRLVETFHNSQFFGFLKAFNDQKNAMLLDLLLAPHVDRIFSQARQHGMIEFFRCYASVSLGEMAQQFCYTILELRDELTRLILAGRLPARIDSVNQILNRDVPNIFTETAFKIEEELNALRDNLRFCMIRTSMARNGLILKNPREELSSGMMV